jgi:uncharacterized membrane protein
MPLPAPVPDRPPWRESFDRVAAQFLTGLLLLLPLMLTLMILDWLVRQVASIFGADTLLGSALTSGGALIFGDGTLGFWMLLAFVVLGIWAIGFAFQDRARRGLERRLDAIAARVPVIGHIYRPVAQLVRVLGKREDHQFASMRPVSVRFGDGVEMLALQVSGQSYTVGGREMLLILVPTAPVPVGGALLFMAPGAVQPVDGMGVEELMTFYVSMGTMAPSLRPAPSPATVAP